MVACLISSMQVKQRSETFSFKAGNQIKTICRGSRFPIELLQQVQCLLRHMKYGTIMDENHTIAKKTRMSSPDGLLQAFQCDAVPTGINCTSMLQDVQQKYTQQVSQYDGQHFDSG